MQNKNCYCGALECSRAELNKARLERLLEFLLTEQILLGQYSAKDSAGAFCVYEFEKPADLLTR
jgi:hypothetical protein